MRIGAYLVETVTIVKVTLAAGDRSEVSVPNVPAAVFKREFYRESPAGKETVSKTFIGLQAGTDITGQDEIILDGVKRSVVDIAKVRVSRYSSEIGHLEVELD